MKRHAGRAAIVGLLLVVAVVLASLDATFTWTRQLVTSLDAIISAHEVTGAFLFVMFSGLSAMLAFFSTAVLVPVAIGAWGKLLTALLLWSGWLCGGSMSYAIGRFFGRRVVRWFVEEEKLRPYEEWLSGKATFRHILLFQFALPSEIPGYVLGLAACPFRRYAVALMIAELPFAIGAVYLGESFLHRDVVLMMTIGLGGILLMLVAAAIFTRARDGIRGSY